MAQVIHLNQHNKADGIVRSLHYLLREAKETGNILLIQAISLAVSIVEKDTVSAQDGDMLACAEFIIKILEVSDEGREMVFEMLATMELHDD